MTAERPTIGVDIEDFRLKPKDALRRAADFSFRVVELPAVRGELAPSNLSSSGRRHLSRLVDGLGLRLVALTADLPGLRLTDPQTVSERVERTLQTLNLATDLAVGVVAAAVGRLTDPETGEPQPLVVDALKRIGEHADRRGLLYALRPLSDTAERLARLLDELGCPSIGICFDPAAMVMSGVNPLSSIDRILRAVVLTHVRDGTAGTPERAGQETRLGDGVVDWVGMLAILDAAEAGGPLILRRSHADDPIADLQEAHGVFTRLWSQARTEPA